MRVPWAPPACSRPSLLQLPVLAETVCRCHYWVVDKIAKSRLNWQKKRVEYLVFWKGYPPEEATWEPWEHLEDRPSRRPHQSDPTSRLPPRAGSHAVDRSHCAPEVRASEWPACIGGRAAEAALRGRGWLGDRCDGLFTARRPFTGRGLATAKRALRSRWSGLHGDGTGVWPLSRSAENLEVGTTLRGDWVVAESPQRCKRCAASHRFHVRPHGAPTGEASELGRVRPAVKNARRAARTGGPAFCRPDGGACTRSRNNVVTVPYFPS
ncbi:hypothetical protein FN846DRAFT_547829 [Sphaerosporella brunnea]|uniref:Chromo domain-containing protein n=1 Tax=Sphaerosporella brunnea TaxID=1250544 RepID=A0A5J5F2B4_9PEZI|nr:hypothetical protein FN846DRAFT_547829 [Sphaerosporella brunnea]